MSFLSSTFCFSAETFLRRIEDDKRIEWEEAKAHHENLSNRDDTKVDAYGSIENFHMQLEDILGKPKKLLFDAMEKEHCQSADSDLEFKSSHYDIRTTSKIEWKFVVSPNDATLKELGIENWPEEDAPIEKLSLEERRKAKPLDAFEKPLNEINKKLMKLGIPALTMIELIACRLFTGAMGPKYQRILRSRILKEEWRQNEEEKLAKGNTYTTTIHVIQSAIAKLGKLNGHSVAYSGTSAVYYDNIHAFILPSFFWEEKTELNLRGGVICGFLSTSSDREVGEYYARGGNGILLEIEMSAMDRGCEVHWLSQYPHEEEILLPPLTFLEVQHIQLAMNKYGPYFNTKVRSRLSNNIRIQKPLLSIDENVILYDTVKDKEQQVTWSKSKLISRFGDEENLLITGNPMKSVLGLARSLGVDHNTIQRDKAKGLKAMEKEILASGEEEVIKNMKYIFYETTNEELFPNGIRDQGRVGMNLDDFCNHKAAKESGLLVEHVAAIRLYTTSAFQYINTPLRKNSGLNDENSKPHPFPITVSFIDEGIKLLRGQTSESFRDSIPSAKSSVKDFGYLYRGIRNTRIDEHFLEERRGGTELGLMSTTRDLKTAVAYSKSDEGCSLLFKIKVENMKQLGADVSWLSAFPTEEEILYPPLTFLQPTGRVETTSIDNTMFTIVEIQPHV